MDEIDNLEKKVNTAELTRKHHFVRFIETYELLAQLAKHYIIMYEIEILNQKQILEDYNESIELYKKEIE